MGRRTTIPVRVVRPDTYQAGPLDEDAARSQPFHPGWDETPFADSQPEAEGPLADGAAPAAEELATAVRDQSEEVEEWRDRALRLQAEMDNYRKRQQRCAQDQIEAERHRLLGGFLRVVDDLERALAAPVASTAGLREGIELTHRAAMQLLQQEGVERIEAKNRAFDPNWHEAVATVGHNGNQAGTCTVVEVVEPGYRLGERLLRPAKVVVAV